MLVVNNEATAVGQPRDYVRMLLARDDVEESLGKVLRVGNGCGSVRDGQGKGGDARRVWLIVVGIVIGRR